MENVPQGEDDSIEVGDRWKTTKRTKSAAVIESNHRDSRFATSARAKILCLDIVAKRGYTSGTTMD